MAIDDSKRCICNPPLSGRNRRCLRCHPRMVDASQPCVCRPPLSGKNANCLHCHPKERVTIVRPVIPARDIKPAQMKKHGAVRTGDLPWLQEQPASEAPATAGDPYDNYPEG